MIENPSDSQNMFSKAGKITSEKYIIFQRKEEIMNNRPRFVKGKKMSEIIEKDTPSLPVKIEKVSPTKVDKEQEAAQLAIKKFQQKLKCPFTKQMSRAEAIYQRSSHDEPPPCGYYHPKYSEIDRKNHHVFDYNKLPTPKSPKSSMADDGDKPIVDKMRWTRDCFTDMQRQIERQDIFKGRPVPHEKRFEYVTINENWSKVPRTPSLQLEKQLSREDLMIYKKKHYAPDYQPNFEFGKKQLGSCGPSFDKLVVRKDIMVKVPPYNHEAYFEFDKYSKSTKSQLFRTPTAPNFDKMLDRECDGKSLLPSFMQKFTNTRMGITHVHQKMLEVNNFRDGRFQTVTSSFMPSNKIKKRKRPDESSDEDYEQEEQQ